MKTPGGDGDGDGDAGAWTAFLGYALAVILLVSLTRSGWVAMFFPPWMLLISAYLLIENYREAAGG